MPDLNTLLEQWRYAAIFLCVILGNVGLPVPEETILALAGYAAWRGDLHLPTVLAVGVLSAVIGDNIGYWLGRRYGRAAIERYGRWAYLTPKHLEKVSRLMTRYGACAVFLARFVAGLRFLAGPLAGAAGLPPLTFMTANVLGALVYVPYAVGIGYGIGYGFGDVIQRLIGPIEHLVLVTIVVLTVVFVAVRVLRARGASP
jgi:membrane protein DedA with SNARE-associated domain